eukprot:m51a1_g6269 hypothetical protein (115) ;mRNA; f:142882-143479
MPQASIVVSVSVPEAKRKEIATLAANILSETIGKPIDYCMANIVDNAGGSMGGSNDPIAFVKVSSIGLPGGSPKKLSSAFCKMLHEQLSIASDRIYLNFEDVKSSNWGWNGSTF